MSGTPVDSCGTGAVLSTPLGSNWIPPTGPANTTVSDVIVALTGQIDAGLLAQSLKAEIAAIGVLRTDLLAETAFRLNDSGALALLLSEVEAATAEAQTYLFEETQERISADSAAMSAFNVMATALGSSLAAVTGEVLLVTTANQVLSESVNTNQAIALDSIAQVAINTQASINAVTGEVNALYTAKVNVNGLVGGFGLSNNGTLVDAGFDVDRFFVGRTSTDKKKPFIISNGTVFIDSAMISKLTADQIDSRGLTIRDNNNNIIFGSGNNLDYSRIGGTGKPANNATVGATIGINLNGQINSNNASTFIANAAIGSAQIANASIGTAQIGNAAITSAAIGDAQIGTLQIAGQAVTIPASASVAGTSVVGTGFTELVQVTVTTPGGVPFLITGTCAHSGFNGSQHTPVYRVGITRNGSFLADGTSFSPAMDGISISDTPPAGVATYRLVGAAVQQGGAASIAFSSRTLLVLGAKR